MVLSVPRYPEFSSLTQWQDQEQFYIPELEMSFGEVCGAMKKCWTGYKIARREADTENQEYYSDIIQGIVEGLGYRPMTFRIAEDYESDMYEPEEVQMDEGEAQEVDLIEEQVQERRRLAIEYGKKTKPWEWDKITKQYVTYISPEDPEDQEFMLDIEEEIADETA
jgi:hypothetical protein